MLLETRQVREEKKNDTKRAGQKKRGIKRPGGPPQRLSKMLEWNKEQEEKTKTLPLIEGLIEAPCEGCYYDRDDANPPQKKRMKRDVMKREPGHSKLL